MDENTSPVINPKPKFLDQVRASVRVRHLSRSTEQSYVNWVRRFVIFHKMRHPRVIGKVEVEQFLSHLAVHERVAASTQNQALSAILFLYRHVLGRDLPWLDNVVRAKRPKNVSVVLTHDEVDTLFAHLDGIPRLVCGLLYGSGLRLMESLRLRVKDMDFAYGQVIVRHPSARGRLRYPNGSGAVGAQGREDDDDLHPCSQSKSAGSQPTGSVHTAIAVSIFGPGQASAG